MRKDEDFSEWYNDVLDRAEITDKRYPIKGMNVWLPYGWAIQKRIDEFLRQQFDATGHREVNFPLLIPESEFRKEGQHVKGFEGDVFWVTRGGVNPLEMPLVLRPTSETAMYPMFSVWIRSHADLPLKVYQIVPVYRYETKMTRALMRVREIHFFEAHTAHASSEDAARQLEEDLQINERLMRRFCLPYVVTKRPDWDKFPGAYYSIGVDTLMPSGRSLQLATFHHYQDNFAKVYDVTFEDERGGRKHVHQTTDGMSERILGGIIAVHGDERGLVLPPDVAPVQAVIVPIPEKGKQAAIEKAAEALFTDLRKTLPIEVDLRDIRPGEKFYHWDARGVPLRIEIGPKELARKEVTLVRRDTTARKTLSRSGVRARIRSILEIMQVEMFARAEKTFRENVHTIASLEEVSDGFHRMGWCGKPSCGKAITEATGMSVLGTPWYSETFDGRCIISGEETHQVLYAARAY